MVPYCNFRRKVAKKWKRHMWVSTKIESGPDVALGGRENSYHRDG